MGKLFGENMSAYVQYAVAFVTILILLLLLAYVLRLITRRRPGGVAGRGRAPRLGVIEVFDLDRQRQLVLLRRDNVEHLVMIGGPNDVVVESAFVRSGAARVPVPQLDADRTDEEIAARLEPPEQMARPVIGERETTAYRPAAPTQASASIVPPPVVPDAAPKPSVAPAVVAPPIAPPSAQPAVPPVPVLPSTTVRQPAPYRPAQPPAPPPIAPMNQPAAAPMPPVVPVTAPAAPAPIPQPPPQPAPAAIPREKSGFASRLEDAMRRPFSSAPRAEPSPAPAPAPASQQTVPPPAPVAPPPPPQPPAQPMMRPPVVAAPAPPPAPPKPAAPVEPPAPAVQNPPPASKTPAAADPFDLGALEDEMAKLLGRAGPKK